MAIPTASVKIDFLKLTGLPAVTLGAGNTMYARAAIRVGSKPWQRSGRSRPIPAAGGDFDLTAEAVPWNFEVTAEPGESISFRVDIHEDRGDTLGPTLQAIYGSINDPWTSGNFQFGSGTKLDLKVDTTLVNPVDPTFLARANKASGVSGTLTIPQGFAVEIIDIKGLYKPSATVAPPAPGSTYVSGYVSEDHKGRIFVNRKPDGSWSKDSQYIDVEARITGIGGRNIPAGAKIEWTVEDIDDPTNEDRYFHREAGFYVDANDYDSSGNPTGAHDKDNAEAYEPGNADESKLFGSAVSGATARWEQVSGGPAVTPSSRAKAESDITGTGSNVGTSKVRVHCMNVLGTNLVLKAKLTGTAAGIPVHNAKTGIMTMWSRIDVEVARMAGAHSLSSVLTSIPPFFHPVCVQLDFQKEKTVSGSTLDKAEMATGRNVLTSSTRTWVNNSSVFSHSGQGGWFFLGAARFPTPSASGGSPTALYNGTTYTLGTTGTNAWLEVPGSLANSKFVKITWTDGSGTSHNASFSVRSSTTSGGNTRIVLQGNDVTPAFTGHDADGSLSHAYSTRILYYPRHQLNSGASSLSAGGFGVPNSGARVEVYPPGATFVTGISPSVPNASTGTGSFFAGRTVLFTHTRKFSTGTPPSPRADFNQKVLSTVVHEFLHAFGMPHKCGYWNWKTPRVKSCCMNYFNTWLIDTSNNLIPGTVGNQHNDMCARHLMEVRRVHLDRNPGLNW